MISQPEENLWVVDSCVGIKWVLKEANSPIALRLIRQDNRLTVPGHFYSEVANVLWKRTRVGEPEERITVSVACEGLRKILLIPLEVTPNAILVNEAIEIALEVGLATYDCEYLVLALRQNALLVTADDRLFDAVRAHPRYGPYVRRLDQIEV